jgi:hypothetical protein
LLLNNGSNRVLALSSTTSQLCEADMNNIKEQLLEIIQANPGLTEIEVHRELSQRSWAVLRLGKWVVFGPTYGSMYVALEELAREGLININRGEGTSEERKGRRRPLRFYPRPTPAIQSSTEPAVGVGDHAAEERQ